VKDELQKKRKIMSKMAIEKIDDELLVRDDERNCCWK
jgi:hypothetical protein